MVFAVIMIVSGMGIMSYPFVSSAIAQRHATVAIQNYSASVDEMDAEKLDALKEAAYAYNQQLSTVMSNGDQEVSGTSYADILGVGESLGYITIPKISQELPVYHGTSEGVLSVAVGHLEGSSLPVGGESTHCVVSAHRGLPTAILFTHLDRMEIGDTFYFTILDRTITYEVDQIRIVEPNDTSLIQIAEGKDYCTLLTCTPYGINTQRLLVRGHQVDATQMRNIYIANEAYRIEPLVVMPFVALPIIFVLLIYVMFAPVKKETLGEDII
jgi:sortase A